MMFEKSTLMGPCAYGLPENSARFKSKPSDFIVEENLPFELSGEGEHVYCFIEKERLNTEQVAKILANLAKIPNRNVSYAGLKDKMGQTRQWFSLHMAGLETPCLEFDNETPVRLLNIARHSKKLSIGALKSNRFEILLRDIKGDKAVWLERLDLIKQGVPNYFGEQRFGNFGRNLSLASDYFFNGKKIKSRYLRGLCFSAARSWLFNAQLGVRVNALNWREGVAGDLMMLEGTTSIFHAEAITQEIKDRLAERDITPAGLLIGEQMLKYPTLEALKYLEEGLKDLNPWVEALKNQRLKTMYRSFVLYPQALNYEFQNDDLKLSFELPKGAYATALLRELCTFIDD